MATQIESDKILIKGVFQRWFRIPEYQRPYMWGMEEVSDLLEDITYAFHSQPTGQYFLGSIVFQTHPCQDANNNSYDEHDLLDGQQRLTTCLLLHAVGRDLAGSANPMLHDACHQAIFQEANPFNGVPERSRIVYDIRPEVRHFVDTFLKQPGGTDDVAGLKQHKETADDISIRNMAAAIIQIREHFENDLDSLAPFFQFFRNNVLLIYVASTDLEDAFRLFTVLNDRGMKLRNSDILKTLNLQALRADSNVKDQEVKDSAAAWEEMESELGDEFDTFLSHVRTVLVKEQARKTLLQEFEENIYKPKTLGATALLKPGAETFRTLKGYRSHYSDIFTTNIGGATSGHTFSNLVVLLRKAARADYWLPPLLYYKASFGNTDLVPFLKKLENKFMAGWVLRNTPSARSEAMNRILRDMDRIKRTPGLSDDQKRKDVLAMPELDCDIDTILNKLGEQPVYGEPYATYVLYKLDMLFGGENTALQPPDYLSVEHILPQNPAMGSQWLRDFTDMERHEWTNRLGNLVLIGRRKNASQGRKDFAEKKQAYFHNHIQLFPNTIRVMNHYPQWTLPELQNNHQKSLNALKLWYQ